MDFGWELVSKDALEEGASLISCVSQQKQEWIKKTQIENAEEKGFIFITASD